MNDPDNKAARAKRSTMKATDKQSFANKPEIYDFIGQRMRDYFGEVTKQPVPDRFMELLDKLASKTSSPKDEKE